MAEIRPILLFALRFGLALAFAPAFAQSPSLEAKPPLHASNPALTEADRLMHQGQFPQAEAVLRTELETHATNADAAYALAYCLLRQNHASDALQQYTVAAVLRRPGSAELVNVGQAYVLLGDDADADKWTRAAVQADPKNGEAWYSLGRIRYTDQRFAEAAACFKHALTLSPRSVKAQNNLGLALEGQNRTDDAVAAYTQAIAWQTAGPPAERSEQPLLNLAIILLHRGATAEAEPLLTQAETISPADPRIHEQLGHLYLQQSKYESAATQFERASAEDPKNSSLHFLLGQAYKRLGRTELSQKEFGAAARLAEPAPTVPSH